jgi:sarcosine oxidase subunit beta
MRHHPACDRPQESLMSETADVIIVGAGVQGASLAFHLAERGASVIVVERGSVAAGATGRSSGFVRMHYDLESETRFAWLSYPTFRDWAERVGEGDCGFVRTGFVQLVAPEAADALRANVAMHQGIGVPTSVIGPAEVAELLPGIVTDDVVAAAYEPGSGYADPTGTAAGFMAAARREGARLIQRCRVASVAVDGDRVTGVETDRGRFGAPVVVNAAGAWAAELAASVGLAIPVEAWRHETAYFGLPAGHGPGFPVVIDHAAGAYFRPEGHDLMLVGLETGNVIGGSPDRPQEPPSREILDEMVAAVCARVPWMTDGTFRTSHGGQDGISPDQRPILGPAGPDGFILDCGFSGTGFKTAPAVGQALAELILDGRSPTVDIAPYDLARFAEGRQLVGEHPYGLLWR